MSNKEKKDIKKILNENKTFDEIYKWTWLIICTAMMLQIVTPGLTESPYNAF